MNELVGVSLVFLILFFACAFTALLAAIIGVPLYLLLIPALDKAKKALKVRDRIIEEAERVLDKNLPTED